MEGLNDRLDTLRWFGAKLLKPMKRSVTGTGTMMATFHTIRAAAERGDTLTLKAAYDGMRARGAPYMWTARYEKHVQLVALCRYLLAVIPQDKTRAYYDLLALLHDESHELTREIVRLLFGPIEL